MEKLEQKQTRAINEWRSLRLETCQLFTNCIDIHERLGLLLDTRLYPKTRDVKAKARLSRSCYLKQIDFLSEMLELCDRKRDLLRQSSRDIERVHRETESVMGALHGHGKGESGGWGTMGGIAKGAQSSDAERARKIEENFRFYAEETRAIEVLVALARERVLNDDDADDESGGADVLQSARKFLEARERIDMERAL